MKRLKRSTQSVCVLACGLGLSLSLAPAFAAPKYQSWAPTPPMGWNSWDAFATTVTEEQTRAQAAYMARNLASYGWKYVVVDIQWYEPGATSFNYRQNAPLNFDEYGRLWPAPNRFPSSANGVGFKVLADSVHAQGLKFGVHLMRGIPRQAVEKNTPILGTKYHAADIADKNSTCPWNPDMYGVDMSKPGAQEYYDSVIKLLASWHIDFIKVDDLSRPYHLPEIEAIRKAIDKTGRPIVFSTSPGETPVSQGEHVSQHANMWRISDDFWDDWPALYAQFKRLDDWTPYRGPGHFPDADMLPLGKIRFGENTRFTPDEQLTMMSLWSIARSPLIMGGDLTKLDPWTLSLMTNQEVLDVNQKSTNNRQLFNRDGFIGWVADVPRSSDKYVALFNTRGATFIDEATAAFASPVVTRNTPGHGVPVDVALNGSSKLYLVADDAGDGFAADHVDWVEPKLVGPKGELKLTDLTWKTGTTGWGTLSTQNSAGGSPLTVDGKRVSYGIGAHARSIIEYDIPVGYTRFQATAALDDSGTIQANGATARFFVFTSSPAGKAQSQKVAVKWSELGLRGDVRVRDLWQKRDLGKMNDGFAPVIPSHGAGLYRISGSKK